MTDIQTKSVSELINEIDAAKQDIKNLQNCIKQSEEMLLKKLQSGESSGDPIIDYVYFMTKNYNSQQIDFYRKIEADLTDKEGQPVLLLGLKYTGDSDWPDSMLYMGILNGSKLIFDLNFAASNKVSVGLPTSHGGCAWLFTLVFDRFKGNLDGNGEYNLVLNENRKIEPHLGCEKSIKIELVNPDPVRIKTIPTYCLLLIGTEEINQFLGNEKNMTRFGGKINYCYDNLKKD